MNQLVTTTEPTAKEVITMTSLELVDFINSTRKEGEAELRHRDFLAKVPKVLGEEMSEKFRTSFKDVMNRDQPCYVFPKHETLLMVMSYSYAAQAKVLERLEQAEEELYGLRLTNTQKQLQIKTIYEKQADLFEAANTLRIEESSKIQEKLFHLQSNTARSKPKSHWDKYVKQREVQADKEYESAIEHIEQTIRDAIISVGLFQDEAMLKLASIEHSYLGRSKPKEELAYPTLCNEVQYSRSKFFNVPLTGYVPDEEVFNNLPRLVYAS